MIELLLILAALALGLHLYRQYWTCRDLPRVHDVPFAGELYRVDRTIIARRPARAGSSRSVVCFPGFLEDMRYFQALYQDDDCELVLVNNANYHSPFAAGDAVALALPDNPFALGTIEYDGFLLGHVIGLLASGSTLTLHGHSRGGAVVLEAGRQHPQLMRERQATAILEAPVLPRARTVGRGSEPLPHALICYLLPLVLGLSRKTARERGLQQPMMWPNNALKTELCACIYTVARNYRTCVDNVRGIRDWQRATDYQVYTHYPRLTVVMGQRDDVLDNASMLASAEAGRRLNPGLSILRTEHSNHFVTLERPEYLRELHAAGEGGT